MRAIEHTQLVTQAELAKRLGKSVRQLRREVSAGRVPPPDYPGRPPQWKPSVADRCTK